MKEETKEKCKPIEHIKGGSAVYGMGLIGALVFYIQQADSFGMGVLGVLKAIVWPAMLVYKLLAMLY